MDFEVCIDSVEGAVLASKHGAKRVELCAALSEGGLTPSAGMIEACAEVSTAEVYVMIRPSAGGFCYSHSEIKLMQRDINAAKSLGAQGVVFGILNPDFSIDIKNNMLLMETALDLELGTTFHRAIDLCPNPLKALESLIHTGFNRVLTSGGKETAEEGIEGIKELLATANRKIEIMAGSGINASNAAKFIDLGVDAIHFTAKKVIQENLRLDMGPKYQVEEFKIEEIARICI